LAAIGDYLCSERPLGSVERKAIAGVVLAAKKPASRPPNYTLYCAANVAKRLYEEWRDRCDSHGHGDKMKDFCAEFVTGLFFDDIEWQDVRDLMERPKNRSALPPKGCEVTLSLTGPTLLRPRQK
jgi:hypothetical protein